MSALSTIKKIREKFGGSLDGLSTLHQRKPLEPNWWSLNKSGNYNKNNPFETSKCRSKTLNKLDSKHWYVYLRIGT